MVFLQPPLQQCRVTELQGCSDDSKPGKNSSETSDLAPAWLFTLMDIGMQYQSLSVLGSFFLSLKTIEGKYLVLHSHQPLFTISNLNYFFISLHYIETVLPSIFYSSQIMLSFKKNNTVKGRDNGNPVFLPGKSQGQKSLVSYSPQGHKESDTTQ